MEDAMMIAHRSDTADDDDEPAERRRQKRLFFCSFAKLQTTNYKLQKFSDAGKFCSLVTTKIGSYKTTNNTPCNLI